MKNCQETHNSCDHCGRVFIRSSTLLKHLCEQKRRWLDREKPANRIGYGTWRSFYRRFHPGKKNTEYTDFLKSNYYTAFIRFGAYCASAAVLNPGVYGDWLIKNNIPIDSWATDLTYGKYLIEYLQTEEPYEAVKRSINNLADISEQENITLDGVLRYHNMNRLCHMIVAGKLSPWLLYNSSSGQEFLAKLASDQANILFDYINPEQWLIKFKREQGTVEEIRAIIKKIGL